MPSIIVPERVPQLLQPFQFAHADVLPQARWAKALANVVNYLRLNQRKEVFSSDGNIFSIPASGGTAARERWSFRCHTGFGIKRFVVSAIMAQTTTAGTSAALTRLRCVPVGGGTTVDVNLVYGNVDSAATVNDSFDEFGHLTSVSAPLVEDTTYECIFEDFQEARIVQATVWEEALGPSTENGYYESNYSVYQNIYDKYRGDLYAALTAIWSRNAAPLIKWSAPLNSSAAPEISSATQTNIIDKTSTAVSSSTPGFYCALQYCRTLALSTVPCVFAVRARTTSGSGGSVYLKDSSGTLATIGAIGTTTQWYTTTVNMPATNAKRDIHFSTSAGTLRVLAVCLYQHF